LAKRPYLLGDALSVLDIAWLIYQNRLMLAGYPFTRLHPRVMAWADRLRAMPEFAKEIEQLRHSPEQLAAVRRSLAGQSLESVAGF
jgi:glutathione S-transferase